jgi:tetratricopeptide (TPR) repeat protein
MGNEFLSEEEGKEWVKRYEALPGEGSSGYLDLEGYEYVIFHYVNHNQPEKARLACERAMELFPFASELLVDYAHVLANCGENQSALETLSRAEVFFPHDIDLIILRCTLLNYEGRHKEVIHYLTEVEPAVEQKERLYQILAATFAQLGSADEALFWYRKSLDLGVSPECLEEFILFLHTEDALEESLPYFRQALDDDPFDPTLWLSYSNVLNTIEEFEEALDAIGYCLALDESMHPGHFQHGNILMNLERYSEAAEAFREAIALCDKEAEYFVGMGAAMEGLDKFDQAIHYFRRAVKVNPEQDDAYFGIGSCLLEMEKYAESIHFFNKAIQHDGENPAYWMSKAVAEYGLGNVVSAETAFEKVFDLDPENVSLWLDWSHLYFEQGQTEKALSMMDEAITLMPGEALLYYRAAAYRFSSGYYKDALQYLENALLLDYDSHPVLYEFFEDLPTQKTLYRLIQDIRQRGKPNTE